MWIEGEIVRVTTGRPGVGKGSVGLRTQVYGQPTTVGTAAMTSNLIEKDVK